MFNMAQFMWNICIYLQAQLHARPNQTATAGTVMQQRVPRPITLYGGPRSRSRSAVEVIYIWLLNNYTTQEHK